MSENQKRINELALAFNRSFYSINAVKKVQEADERTKRKLRLCYSFLQEIGKLRDLEEPSYWFDAYDTFCAGNPDFENVVVEMEYYLMAIVATKDEELNEGLQKVYSSKHHMYYCSMMFLFVAISSYFYSYEGVRGDVVDKKTENLIYVK